MRDRILAGLRRTAPALFLSAWTFASAHAVAPAAGPNWYIPGDLVWFCDEFGNCTKYGGGWTGNPGYVLVGPLECGEPYASNQWVNSDGFPDDSCDPV